MSNDNKIFLQGFDNSQKLKLSQPINQYDQTGTILQDKKSIFGDKKPNDNYSDVSNRSRGQSNVQPKPSLTPKGQDQGLFFQNPQTQPIRQGDQIQTFSGQQTNQKLSNVYDNSLSGGNNQPLKQSQVVYLTPNNYMNPQQQNRDTLSKQNIFMNQSTVSQAPTVNKNLLFNNNDIKIPQNKGPEQIFEMRNSTVVKIDPQVKQSISPGTTLKQGEVPWFFNKKVVVTGASSGIGRAVAIW
jgi:hypothetical protein